MRSTAKVVRETVKEIREVHGNLPYRKAVEFCEIEVGLLLQERLAPDTPADEAWALFSGYPFALARGTITERQEWVRRTARFALWTWGRRRAWQDALEEYQRYDRRFRAYDVPDPQQPAVRRPGPPVAQDRWREYERLLEQAPPFSGEPVPPAGAGRYAFPVGRHLATVPLPPYERSAVRGHDLSEPAAGRGEPVTIRWSALRATAAAMDARRFARWEQRLEGIRLSTRGTEGFEPADRFEVAGIQHLLGIVGAGKSTLRDIIAVHLARRGLRVTVVVGDVAEELKLVELYNTYAGEGSAAPVLGAQGREQHAERLHRRLIGRGTPNPLAHLDPAFRYLSTSCALNALRADDGHPADDLLGFGEAPCTRLQPPKLRADPEQPWGKYRKVCPFWAGCPRHHGPRSLVDAPIWVATPASLVDSQVPRAQNAERIRYLELACRRSDLVIIDEADRVQMQLDRMFAPAIPLLGGGPDTRSFLDEVNQHRIRELASAGRAQLSDRDVENWSAAVNTTQAAADRLVAMLVRDYDLRSWVRTGYFSAWTLQLETAGGALPPPGGRRHPGRGDRHRTPGGAGGPAATDQAAGRLPGQPVRRPAPARRRRARTHRHGRRTPAHQPPPAHPRPPGGAGASTLRPRPAARRGRGEPRALPAPARPARRFPAAAGRRAGGTAGDPVEVPAPAAAGRPAGLVGDAAGPVRVHPPAQRPRTQARPDQRDVAAGRLGAQPRLQRDVPPPARLRADGARGPDGQRDRLPVPAGRPRPRRGAHR
ncbi:hypothetical protein ACFQ2M_31310 [Kitasatospora saccharophila]|uniref:pPIWI_RE_Z domain-containing protein n=1 Tax=Kitasatospora saccharophila TaxID=407973 RepID=UPI003632C35A